MKFLVVLACLLAAVYADIVITGNASVSLQSSGEWNYRSVAMSTWNAGLWGGMYFNSIKAGGNGQGTGSAEAIWGAAYAGTGTNFPAAWLATFGLDWDFTGVTNFATANVSASGSFLASSFLRILEKNAAGTVVTEHIMKNWVWTTEASSTTGTVKYITFKGKPLLNSTPVVHIHFMISSVLGKVNLANTIVSPKTLESVVEITYDYKDPANTITLEVVAASGAGVASGNAFIVGSGEDKVYFAAAKQAMIGGKLEDVKFSAFATGTIDATFANNDLKAQLNAKYGGAASVQILQVTFPAGKSPIQYDPTMGQGEVLDQGSSAVIVPAFLFLLVAILLNLLM